MTITAQQLWDAYISKNQTRPYPPNVYTDLKISFYSGLVVFFVMITDLETELQTMPEMPDDEQAALMESVRQSIKERNGKSKEMFDSWFKDVHSKTGMADWQKEILSNVFYTAMEVGFHTCSVLAGPSDEPDEIGSKRVRDFRDRTMNDIEEIIDSL